MIADQVKTLAKIEKQLTIRHTNEYSVLVTHYIECNGVDYTIKLLKQLKNYVERYSIGLKVEPIRFLKSNKRGFPRVLRPYKNLITGSPNQKRAIVSLFKLVDNITVDPVLNTETITSPSKGVIPPEILTYAYDFKGIRPYTVRPTNIHLSAKAGPNGKASARSMCDLAAIASEPDLLQSILNLHRRSGIATWMIGEIQSKRFLPDGIYQTGKLSLIRDKAGKTRVIAIGDYWTQSALRPIHDWLISGLKRMTTDATHNQGYAKQLITKKLAKACFVGSADLTAATDRFPVELTFQMLKSKLGKRAYDWITVITKRKFAPFGSEYAVGQPMGFYSSWPAFAISIHILVEYSAFTLGKRKFRDYVVLGDDVAIFDERVYLAFLDNCKIIGLDVNGNKSTIRTKAGEFAKQLYVRKNKVVHDITGLPVTHLKKLVTAPFLASDFLAIAKSRGYDLTPLCESVFALISTLPFRKKVKAHAISQVLFNLNVNSQSPLFTPLKEIQVNPDIAQKLDMSKHGLYHGWLTEDRYNNFRYIRILENIYNKVIDSKEFERLDRKVTVHETHPMAYAVGEILGKLVDEIIILDYDSLDKDKLRTLLQDAEVYIDNNCYRREHLLESNVLTLCYDRKEVDDTKELLEIEAITIELLKSDLFSARFYYLTLANKPKSKKRPLKGAS